MKTIHQIFVLLLFCFAAITYGQGDFITQGEATACIIRSDKIKDTSAHSPWLSTGVLLCEKGHVFTTTNLVTIEEIKADKEVPFLVLFPVFDQTGKVSFVKCYRGFYQRASTDTNTLVIKIPDKDLPKYIDIDDKGINSIDHRQSILSLGYSLKQTLSNEEKDALTGLIQDIDKKLDKESDKCHKVDNEQQRKSTMALMKIMTPEVIRGQITQMHEQQTSKENIIHTIHNGSGGYIGAPLFRSDSGCFIGMYTEPGKAQDAQTFLATASNFHICIGGNEDNTMIILLCCAGALVLVIVIILIVKCFSAPPSTIIRLRGEDGESYDILAKKINKGPIIIGRSAKACCRFCKSTISGKHAELCNVDGRIGIVDCDSKGGTYVRGEQLEPGKPVSLHDGDVIKLADYAITVSVIQK